jgi:hypothetical protein
MSQSDVLKSSLASHSLHKNPAPRWVAEKVLYSITYYKANCIQQVEINTWSRYNLCSQKHTWKPQGCCPIIMWLFCKSHCKLLWLALGIPQRVIGGWDVSGLNFIPPPIPAEQDTLLQSLIWDQAMPHL